MDGYYGGLLNDDHGLKDPVPSAEFNSHARILNSQLVGALQAIGTGCIEEDAWSVTAGSGLSVDVSAGAGIAQDGAGYVLLRTGGATNVVLPANSTRWLYALAVYRVDPQDPDSREDGMVQFYTNATGEDVAGGILLAQVVTGSAGISSITDARTFCRGLTALMELETGGDDLEAVKAALGADYFGADPPPTVDARLDDLEAAAADGEGGGPVYWGVLTEAAGDPTTIEQHVDAEIAAHVEALHAEDEANEFIADPEPWDEDSVNLARHVLRATRATDDDLPAYLLDNLVVVWGLYGDGSDGSPDFVDRLNSTWLPAIAPAGIPSAEAFGTPSVAVA